MKWNDCVMLIFGLVMGAVLGAILLTLALPNHLLLGNDGRLQWETLVTGVAAVLAAVLTIVRLSEQIRQTAQLAADQRQRRARAARAMLPLALMELDTYATACINGLYALRPCFQSDGSLDRSQAGECLSTWTLPRLPENVLSLLKECIEFIDETPAEALIELIRHFQVQNFRLKEDIARLRLNDGVHLLIWANIEKAIQDAAELCGRASSIYPFSRGSSPQAFNVDRTHIRTALSLARCFHNLQEIDSLVDGWERDFTYRTATKKIGD